MLVVFEKVVFEKVVFEEVVFEEVVLLYWLSRPGFVTVVWVLELLLDCQSPKLQFE